MDLSSIGGADAFLANYTSPYGKKPDPASDGPPPLTDEQLAQARASWAGYTIHGEDMPRAEKAGIMQSFSDQLQALLAKAGGGPVDYPSVAELNNRCIDEHKLSPLYEAGVDLQSFYNVKTSADLSAIAGLVQQRADALAGLDEKRDMDIELLTRGVLDQAKGLGSQLEAYEQKGEALRSKTETMQGFLDFANKLKPSDSKGTFDGKALSDEAGRISQKTGYNPLDLVGMHQLALKGDLSASEGDQIIEALSGHIETLGSQNETVQTHLKRIYESRNECYSFVSAMLQSVGRNMSSVAQSISSI